MKKSKLILLIVFICVSVFAKPNKLITAVEMNKDIAILQSVFENIQAGIYRFNMPIEIKQAFAKINTKAILPLNISDFYFELSKPTTKVIGGYTYWNLYNQNLVDIIVFSKKCLPFFLSLNENKIIITHVLNDESNLKQGDEVKSINKIDSQIQFVYSLK